MEPTDDFPQDDDELIEISESTTLSSKARKYAILASRPEYSDVAAAKAAGYAAASNAVARLNSNPLVQRLILQERARYDRSSHISLDEILEIIRDGVDRARILDEPRTMIAGASELAKLGGYYDRRKVKATVNEDGKMTVEEIRSYTDDELLEMIAEQERIAANELDKGSD